MSGIDAHLALLRDSVSGGIRDFKAAAAEAALLQRPLDLPPAQNKD